MWYEILPSFGIIVVAMALPHVSAYVINKAVVGNPYRRSLIDKELVYQYFRDTRLNGDPYVMKGLENIADN